MPDKLIREEAARRVMEDLLNALLAEELMDGLRIIATEDANALTGSDKAFAAARKLLLSSTEEIGVEGGSPSGGINGRVCADGKNGKGKTRSTAHRIEAAGEAGQTPFDERGGLIGLWRPGGDDAIVFGLRRSPVQRLRCEPAALVAASNVAGEARLLSPPELMRRVADSRTEAGDVRPEGTEAFIDMLRQTAKQIAWSLERRVPVPPDLLALPPDRSLLALERCAAFRDRPFHPVAKAKLGWGRGECGRYTAEAEQPIRLRWMAVRRDRLLTGDGAGDALPQSLLLPAGEQAELDRELMSRGLHGTHIALPVHPWQMEEMLPQRLRPELASGVCVPLDTAAGTFYATSSVRSLMSLGSSPRHVKLPLGIRSLGGLRYLSAIKLMNGVRAESLLRQARRLDPVLDKKLYLCEEGSWWALAPHDNDLFADDPRHLSAMIRSYPRELAGDVGYRLVPMSALAVHGAESQLFGEWLRQRGLPSAAQGTLELFREIALMFGELSLRLLRFGLVPEAHGQNAVLVLKAGRVCGLLLRDHDALRVHVPWLREAGLDDPGYLLRPGVPNSLYHDSPQQLLAFFQMLGIQVNLFAIMDSLSNVYGISEERLWTELKEVLQIALDRAALPQRQEEVIHAGLFRAECWPWKQVVRPLLAQSAKVPGSMPYGKGEMPNPLRAAEPQEVPHAAY